MTVEDYDAALHFYRDVLGLAEKDSFEANGGRLTILEAGRATVEIAEESYAEYIDEVEVGRRVAGRFGSSSRSTTPLQVPTTSCTPRRTSSPGRR